MNSLNIDIQNDTWSDEKIASVISTGVSLTGEEGLTDAAKQLETFTLSLADTGFNMADEQIDKYLDILFDIIMQFLSDNGVIKVIEDCVNVANVTISFANEGLQFVSSGATIAANVIERTEQLCSIFDPNTTYIPSAKGPVSALGASLKEIIISQYYIAKQQLLDLKNSLICTSNDAVIDNVIASVNAILNFVEPIIDPYLAEYTGHTVSEVQFLCNTGFKLIDMITRAVAISKVKKTKKDEEEEEQEESDESLKEKDSDSDEEKKKKRAKKSKKEFDKKKKDFSKEEAKAKFMEWIRQQNFILQNAFMLVMIKGMITDIQVQCQKLQNSGIESFADFMNAIDMVFKIFELMGYEPGKSGITFDDIIELASIVSATAVNAAVGVADQIESNAMDSVNNTKNTAQNEVNNAKNTAQNTVNEAQSTAENAVENAKNTAEDEANNAAAAAQNTANDITTEEYSGEVFKVENSYDGKEITLDMTIYADPTINSSIYDYVKSFTQNNGKPVFSNIKIKNIKDNIQDAWDDEEDLSFTITAKVDGVMKKYIFNITIDSETYKQWAQEQQEAIAKQAEMTAKEKEEAAKKAAEEAAKKAEEDAKKAAEEAEKKAIQAKDKSLAALKNAISELANVNINIDMTLINNYFQDKVLMFDFIVKILDALWPVYEIIKVLAHLMENYKINKEFVRTKQRVSIAQAAKTISQVYNSLYDIINLEDTNFFPVRTQNTANWIKNNFGEFDANGNIVTDIVGTAKLYDYCVKNGINPTHELSLIKGTTIYFEVDNSSSYKDGTLNGLDNVDYNEELNEVYYDSKHRSTIASQILRAKKNGEDPYLSEVKTPSAEQNTYADLFKKITVETDEFEGQQVFSMDNLYCCQPVEQLDVNENESKFYTIIEFADEYTNDIAVDYTWNVKPGDKITDQTILAYIHKDSSLIPVKSIYSKGYVRENTDHTFWHLYPDSCNRHICLCDTSLGTPSSFDYNDLTPLVDNMADSGVVFNMLMNYMMQSLYPIMLKNAHRPGDIDNNIIHYSSNVNTEFSDEMHTYNDMIKTYSEQIASLSSADNIKGNIKDLNGLGDQIINVRNNVIYPYIKTTYNNIKNRKVYSGDTLYQDSEGLAYDTTYYRFQSSYVDEYNIGEEKYDNYYMQLLANIDMSSDNKYIKSYHNLIKDIINNRIQEETINISDLINQFNQLYNTNIGYNQNPYNMICNDLTDYSFKNVQEYLKKKRLTSLATTGFASGWQYAGDQSYSEAYNEVNYVDVSIEGQENLYKNLEKAIYTQTDNDGNRLYNNNTYMAPINQLTNIFIMIKTSKKIIKQTNKQVNINNYSTGNQTAGNAISGNTANSSLLQYINGLKNKRKKNKALIEKEANKIMAFWDDLISKYENELSYESTLKAVTDYMNNLNQYSEWPQAYDVKINNDNYKLYTFMNKKEPDPIPDIDLTGTDFTKTDVPDYTIDYGQIADINGPGNITILDYEYWLVYMMNATLFTLIPTYWANGFDVPPNMTPTLLPAIYFPIMKPINVPIINVTMVLGLAIRGIWIFPIILIVNQNSSPINVIFPAIVVLQETKQIFELTLSTLEQGIPAMVDKLINQYAEENAEFKKDLDKFRTYASILGSIPIEDKALIEEEFRSAVYDEKEKIDDAKAKRKAEREKKKRDKRQVITREENLGEGEEPF